MDFEREDELQENDSEFLQSGTMQYQTLFFTLESMIGFGFLLDDSTFLEKSGFLKLLGASKMMLTAAVGSLLATCRAQIMSMSGKSPTKIDRTVEINSPVTLFPVEINSISKIQYIFKKPPFLGRQAQKQITTDKVSFLGCISSPLLPSLWSTPSPYTVKATTGDSIGDSYCQKY